MGIMADCIFEASIGVGTAELCPARCAGTASLLVPGVGEDAGVG